MELVSSGSIDLYYKCLGQRKTPLRSPLISLLQFLKHRYMEKAPSTVTCPIAPVSVEAVAATSDPMASRDSTLEVTEKNESVCAFILAIIG
jgi:hypothetical protein